MLANKERQLSIFKFTILSILLLPLSVNAAFDHGPWDQLLNTHVIEFDGGERTAVDYRALQADRQTLTAYLDSLAAIGRQEFDGWDSDEQLAFLINAYNAWTVDLILSRYPAIDSIRDIGFLPNAAWRRDIVQLFGGQVSLDHVEHELIRGSGRYQEPRIHFAVNCAAIGCPALRAEAYTGGRLEAQLEDSTRLFLADEDRNYIEGSTAYISEIFDWYEEDFQKGWLGVNSVSEFLARYPHALKMDNATRQSMQAGEIRISHLDYDWGLNDLPE